MKKMKKMREGGVGGGGERETEEEVSRQLRNMTIVHTSKEVSSFSSLFGHDFLRFERGLWHLTDAANPRGLGSADDVCVEEILDGSSEEKMICIMV
jgi:hypothetical protein